MQGFRKYPYVVLFTTSRSNTLSSPHLCFLTLFLDCQQKWIANPPVWRRHPQPSPLLSSFVLFPPSDHLACALCLSLCKHSASVNKAPVPAKQTDEKKRLHWSPGRKNKDVKMGTIRNPLILFWFVVGWFLNIPAQLRFLALLDFKRLQIPRDCCVTNRKDPVLVCLLSLSLYWFRGNASTMYNKDTAPSDGEQQSRRDGANEERGRRSRRGTVQGGRQSG